MIYYDIIKVEYKIAYLAQSNFEEVFMIVLYLYVFMKESHCNNTEIWVVKL